MADVQLTFINNSHDTNNTQILIFQKNVAADSENTSVAWKVLKDCGPGKNHKFTFPGATFITSTDSAGNVTAPTDVVPGRLYEVRTTGDGDTISVVGESELPTSIQLRNSHAKGVVHVKLYKGGKLLAVKTNLAPDHRATFTLSNDLWVGAVYEIPEGAIIHSAILSDIHTQFNLTGILSADIVMMGGGQGKGAIPFRFSLENIVYS